MKKQTFLVASFVLLCTALPLILMSPVGAEQKSDSSLELVKSIGKAESPITIKSIENNPTAKQITITLDQSMDIGEGRFVLLKKHGEDEPLANLTLGDTFTVDYKELEHGEKYDLQYIHDLQVDNYLIENQNFYDIIDQLAFCDADIVSGENSVSGLTNPKASIKLQLYTMGGMDMPYVELGEAVADEKGHFTIDFERILRKGQLIMATVQSGLYSQEKGHLTQGAYEGEPYIYNGSFLEGLEGWVTRPEYQIFTQKNGYGNFKAKETGDRIGANQNFFLESEKELSVLKKPVRYSMDVRVNALEAEEGTLIYGNALCNGSMSTLAPTKRFTSSDLGEWTTVYVILRIDDGDYGFFGNNIADMDIKNVKLEPMA